MTCLLCALAYACGGSTSTISVTAPDSVRCGLTLRADTTTAAADGARLTIGITTERECAWTAATDVAWIQLSPANGQGDGSVVATVAANGQARSRSGAFTANDQRLTIVQEARPCTFALESSSARIGHAGGRGRIQVSTLADCSWRASSSAEWVRVPGAAFTGASSAEFDVSPNTGTERQTTVTAADQPFTIVQEGAPAVPDGGGGPSNPAPDPGPGTPAPQTCTPRVSPTSIVADPNGGSASVRLDLEAGCDWTASSGAGWITFGSPTSGRGAANISLSFARNTGGARTGTVTIAQQQVTVTQAAATPACTYSLEPASANVGALGGDGRFRVATQSGCSWSASSGASWITVATATGTGSGDVTYVVLANTSTSPRTGTVTAGGQSHTITQAAAVVTCTYSLDPTSSSVTAGGGDGRFRVVTQNGCTWSASDGASWLTLKTSSGTGNGEIVYTAQANSASTARSAAISAGGRSHTVNQAAATPSCSYSLEPTSANVGATGGEGRFRVSTQSGCTWTASSGAAWTAITSGSSGTGTGEVVYTVTANASTSSRSMTIAAGGQSHTITQAAAAPTCSYSLDPASASLSASGGESRFRVVTQSGCTWTASSGASWATVTSGSNGTGPGDVVYSVQANSTTATRSATISAGGQSHTINQAAAAPTCTYSLDPTSASIGATGGESRFRVVTQSGCAWTASSAAPWATVTSGSSGSGPGEVAVTAQANSATSSRTATITAGGQAHTLTQAAAAPACTYSLDPTAASVGASGGESRFRVVTQSGCAWTASSGASWASITSGSSGTGPGDVVYTVQSNTATSTRSASITAGGQSHTVNQAAAAPTCTYSLDPTSASAGASGGESRFRVVTQSGCAWTASSGASWASITGGSSGTGPGDVVYTVQANSATSTRSTSISAGGQTHTVTQAAAAPACTYSLDPTSTSVSASGGERKFNVVTQAGCAWTTSTATAWISVSPSSGTGPGEVTYTAQANTSSSARTGTITAGGQTHTVTQNANGAGSGDQDAGLASARP